MARQATDRNEVVLKERKTKDKPTKFVTSKGVEIELKDIDLLFVQQVARSVKIPETPTYSVKTMSGREEHYPLDAEVVKQSPEFKPVWDKYIAELQNAQEEQARRSTRAIFLDGTVVPESWRDEKWEKRMKIIGYPLPEDSEERWITYLETSLTTQDAMDLIQAIIRRTNVPEEIIQQAEDAFRDQLRANE